MADTKISNLSAVTDVLGTDEYVLARSGATKKIDASDLFSEIAASGNRVIEILVTDPADASPITGGDGKAFVAIPAALNGMNLVAAQAHVTTASSSGLVTVQIANVTDSVDMLSTKVTIDANEKDSATAATPPVIDTTKDDVATGDELRVDIDGAGTGAKGLIVMLTFQTP